MRHILIMAHIKSLVRCHVQLKTGATPLGAGKGLLLDEERAPLLDAPSLPGPHMHRVSSGNLKL